MILSKAIGTVCVHNFVAQVPEIHWLVNTNTLPKAATMKLTSVWDDLIFVSLSATQLRWFWIWQASSAFSLSVAFIFVNHHICSPPTSFHIEKLQSLQTFLTRQVLYLLNNFFCLSLCFLLLLFSLRCTELHSLPTSLQYWYLHIMRKWCLSCHQCPSWWCPVLCCLLWLLLHNKEMNTENCQKCLQDFYWMKAWFKWFILYLMYFFAH